MFGTSVLYNWELICYFNGTKTKKQQNEAITESFKLSSEMGEVRGYRIGFNKIGQKD